MEKLWEPPAGELIVAMAPFRGNLLVFTDKGVYELEPPPKIPWYKRLWNWQWVHIGIGDVWK